MGDNPPPQTSSTMLPSPPSEMEAVFYYYGLPSRAPRLVARSSTSLWKKPRGPEAYPQVKELRPVANHAIVGVWEDKLAFELHALLESMKVEWTSTDVVRIGIREESSAPVVLWVGVKPASLSGERGVHVVSNCRLLLSGTLQRRRRRRRDPRVRRYALGRTPAPRAPPVERPRSTPWVEGGGGIFIGEGGNNERLLLLTPRHVVLPDKHNDQHFEHRNPSQPRHEVTLFGQAAFKKYLESIEEEIKWIRMSRQSRERWIAEHEGRDDEAANGRRNKAQRELQKLEETIEDLSKLQEDVSTRWATPESRLLGHVILSPPIDFGFGSEGYTHDWALIEIDTSKVNASNFDGNAIDLGTNISMEDFIRMMKPCLPGPPIIDYPLDRLLKINGTISGEEMRNPTAFDQSSNSCVMLKRGNATGLTVGRANNLCSYARNYFDDGSAKTSKEWAILSRDSRSGAFSEQGDSGAIIVDGRGRAGGLLTGGTGATHESMDITYATPIEVLLKHMRELGIRNPHVDLSRTA